LNLAGESDPRHKKPGVTLIYGCSLPHAHEVAGQWKAVEKCHVSQLALKKYYLGF
jgi:hypothetical protein